MFDKDSLPDECRAYFPIERLEALIDLGLIGPTKKEELPIPPIKDLGEFFSKTENRLSPVRSRRDEFAKAALIAVAAVPTAAGCLPPLPYELARLAVELADQLIERLDRPKP
jgi:hypothetical protein